MAQKNIIIVCGEASGDMHAGSLAASLKIIDPEIEISGVGGTCLRMAGAKILRDIKDLTVLGLFDVFIKLPQFFALKKLILRKIESVKPAAIILVDFSGFNLRLAKAINKKIPVIYYVSPQVWASRRGRVETIKKYVHKMIVLFKFEEEFYKTRGVAALFFGHPLLEQRPAENKDYFLKAMGLNAQKPIFALLPGSRNQEIRHILPVMLKSALLLRKNFPEAQFIIAKSAQVDLSVYNRLIRNSKTNIRMGIIESKTCDCLNVANFALIASGTATLEAAIMQKPFAVIYKMGLLNYLLYRPQVKVPHICIANIIAKRQIVPEFIQFDAKPAEIAAFVTSTLNNPAAIKQIETDLSAVKSLLGEPGASLRAARAILAFLNKK